MKLKIINIFSLSLIINLLLCSIAFSVCYETIGGKLQPGSIGKYISSILRSYETDVSTGAVYTVQKNQGYYFKICNEPLQIEHFMEKWAYPEVPNGGWKSFLTTEDKSKINVIKEVGIFKVQKKGTTWTVWKYTPKEEITLPMQIAQNPTKTASESAFSFEETKPEEEYRNVILLENEEVYGVTDQKSEAGKYIPVKLTGEEKVKVLLYEFTMKDDVTIDMLKSDKTQTSIINILTIENKISVKLLREWLKDKNLHNRDKAAYLLDIIGNTYH